MENIVRTNKLRIKAKNTADIKKTLTLIEAAVDIICKRRQKSVLIHTVTEANKALRFFSEGVVI